MNKAIVTFECLSCGATNELKSALVVQSNYSCTCCEFVYNSMFYDWVFDEPDHLVPTKIDFTKIWDFTRIVEQLRECEFTCEAGPLEHNTAFIALCQVAEKEDREMKPGLNEFTVELTEMEREVYPSHDRYGELKKVAQDMANVLNDLNRRPCPVCGNMHGHAKYCGLDRAVRGWRQVR